MRKRHIQTEHGICEFQWFLFLEVFFLVNELNSNDLNVGCCSHGVTIGVKEDSPYLNLVGGFNPFKKTLVKLDHLPNFRGEKLNF